jgi:hypothetical protein
MKGYTMVKVLIYSSKDIYDRSSYAGRAEAHVIAYRDANEYVIVKNRTFQGIEVGSRISTYRLSSMLDGAERDEWRRDRESHELKARYENHPYIELSKNDVVDTRSDM